MKNKICTIVGARPQFVKLAPLSRELRKHFREIIVHTGQHYDYELSGIFFKELALPKPDYNLNIGSGRHGEQTGAMLSAIEKVLLKEKPDLVLVYGDTNSTLAGALAAVKLHIPVAHVEAGLRSFNRKMPEEVNRVLTDKIATRLFCPTETAVRNLKDEGIKRGVYKVGDIMFDAVLSSIKVAERRSKILKKLNLTSQDYCLATVHRAENTDRPQSIRNIIRAFNELGEAIIFPAHPRTQKAIIKTGLKLGGKIKLIDPVGYLDMLVLEKNARLIFTDSGGVQKEAYFFGIPCLTLRDETEWVETVEAGWNKLVGTSVKKIVNCANTFKAKGRERVLFFGSGKASEMIVKRLLPELAC
ncbi:MAG: UDP-N-acetylglucosamine 2-epimerase (non-hydrolyzing) [Candidatus Margulisiibacteriota bacterium]